MSFTIFDYASCFITILNLGLFSPVHLWDGEAIFINSIYFHLWKFFEGAPRPILGQQIPWPLLLPPRHSHLLVYYCRNAFERWLGPNFIELLKQGILLNNSLLSRNEKDTSLKLYIWLFFAGNLILVSKIIVLSYFLCSSMKLGPDNISNMFINDIVLVYFLPM